MSQYIQIVETAIGAYLQHMRNRGNPTPRGVTANTLAHLAGVPVSLMSTCLQEYRYAQGRPRVRPNLQYVLGCEGYGRDARWMILSRPSSDPAYVQNARCQHAKHVARDACTRYMRDCGLEVRPGLQGAQHDQLIDNVVSMLATQLQAGVTLVEATIP